MWAFNIDYFKKQVLVWEKNLKTFRDILIRQEVTVNSEIHLITHFYLHFYIITWRNFLCSFTEVL